MNWDILKEERCPKCQYDLKYMRGFYKCISRHCDFQIGEQRFIDIINDLDREKRAQEMEGYGFE